MAPHSSNQSNTTSDQPPHSDAATQSDNNANQIHKRAADIRTPGAVKSTRKSRSSKTVRQQNELNYTQLPAVSKFSKQINEAVLEADSTTQKHETDEVEYYKQVTPLNKAGAMHTQQPETRERLARLHSRHYQPASKPAKSEMNNSDSPSKRRAFSLIASGAVALFAFGYVAYLNFPNVAVRVAASRAGFQATMPNYKPGGYTFAGPVHYTNEQVVISFRSNTDDREYQIIERQTNWDSGSLLENYVAKESDRYLTFQESGLTVYIFNGSQAAWINKGVWYRIAGDAALNTEQVLKIAASL